MISRDRLQKILDNCSFLLSATEQLGDLSQDRLLKEHNDNILKALRKVVIANELSEKNIICIAGLQGAGKTTFVKNLYGLTNEQANITIGRGEKLPILITEHEIDTVSNRKVFMHKTFKDDKFIWEKKAAEISEEDFIKLSSGQGTSNVMMLEMQVPYKYINNDYSAFLLLPGFEDKNDYWKSIIEFSVACSDTCVFLLNGDISASKYNSDIMDKINALLKDSKPIYALSFSDLSEDGNAELKSTCMNNLKIPENEKDRIVCVGDYKNPEKNERWISELINSLETYALSSNKIYENRNNYISQIIKEDIYLSLKETRVLLQDDKINQLINVLNENEYLDRLDSEFAKQKRKIERKLKDILTEEKNKSCDYVSNILIEKKIFKKIRQQIFGKSVKDISEIEKMIKESFAANRKQNCDTNDESVVYNCFKKATNQTNYEIISDKNNAASNLNPKIVEDVAFLLGESDGGKVPIKLNNNDVTKVLKIIPELATNFYLNQLDKTFENCGKKSDWQTNYVPIDITKLNNAGNTGKNLLLGMFGIAGIDILPDGELDFLTSIAGAFGISVGKTLAILGVASAAGMAVKLGNDIERSNTKEYFELKNYINNVYLDCKSKYIEAFEEYSKSIKERVEGKLIEINGYNRNSGTILNALNAINLIEDELDEICVELNNSKYDFGGNLGY